MTRSTKGPKVYKPGYPRRTAANDKYHNFKNCEKCGERKKLADFYKSSNWRKYLAANPKRYRRICKTCSIVPAATKVDPNFVADRVEPEPRAPKSKAETRAVRATYKRRARRTARVKALQYVAEKGCCECGTRDPRVLEFDHINPADKSVHIVKLLSDGYSWGAETLRAEIRKCRVICANCHRKHTIVQQGYYAHDEVKDALREIYDKYDISE